MGKQKLSIVDMAGKLDTSIIGQLSISLTYIILLDLS